VEMIQAGAAGQLDIGATSNTVTFFNAVARGLRQPFTLDIWHLERGDRSSMVALRPDLADEIKQAADLPGRIHAIPTPAPQPDPRPGWRQRLPGQQSVRIRRPDARRRAVGTHV